MFYNIAIKLYIKNIPNETLIILKFISFAYKKHKLYNIIYIYETVTKYT